MHQKIPPNNLYQGAVSEQKCRYLERCPRPPEKTVLIGKLKPLGAHSSEQLLLCHSESSVPL